MVASQAAVQAESAPARIAFFDLDRTITRSGTYSPFLLHCTRSHPSRYSRVPLALAAMGAYVARKTSRAALKARMLDLFIAGATRDEVAAWAEAFVARWMQIQVRPGALNAIENHQKAGDQVVMATASFDFYAHHFGARLGLDHTIATVSVWDDADRLCAAVGGENCYGPAKIAAVEKYLSQFEVRPQFVFYSDHHSDFELLKMADEGIAVNPNKKLRALASQNGMQVVDWG